MALPATASPPKQPSTNATVFENVSGGIAVLRAIQGDEELVHGIGAASALILRALRADGRLLLAGNGGSAADAQHIAAEFVGRYKAQRRAMPALALTVNTSTLTAIGNDYGFEEVFARQVEAFGRPGDVLLALSTSGNSRNILKAVVMASALRVRTIGMTGHDGGKLKNATDLCLCVPSQETPRIQEAHILIGHTISEIVETELFRN